MDQTVLKIAMAGLLHDVGKFAQGSMDIPRQYANDNADQYQPFYNNHHTHVHALYTAAFIEQFAEHLPPQFNEPGWGEGDSFINLAAGHHKPETALQWIIAMGDRISSGLDRATFEDGEKIDFRDFRKTRLLPMFEKLGDEDAGHGDKLDEYFWRYPLAPQSASSIFPVRSEDKKSTDDPKQEYKDLFDVFTQQLNKLEHRHSNPELWANHFDSLLKTCTAHIPAARVGDVIPDVSLYDHARTTAAFASALYEYHVQTGSLEEKAIKERAADKLLLVTGDFYGIQNFIFSAGGDMKKYRSKLLRGRSFTVSLLSELAADMICRELGLSFLSVVLNAAGRFTVLAPNTEQARKIVALVQMQINDWLFNISCGQASMGIAVTPASPAEFQCNAYGELHDRHMRDVQQRKEQKLDLERYGGAIDGYLESFDSSLAGPICGLCGKRPATAKASMDRFVLGIEEIASCSVCRDHVLLGTGVAKHDRLAILDGTNEGETSGGLLCPLFGRYQVRFTGPSSNLQEDGLLKLWQVSVNRDGSLFSEVTMRPINGYIPLYRPNDEGDDCLLADIEKENTDPIRIGDPKTFSHIALKARTRNSGGKCVSGTEALGILKADVDNLGLLMGCGLPEKRFTLTRLATLSRQVDGFFSIYLPNLLAGHDDFNDIYTVFAGGDDLFLIGPWNKIAGLALYLKEHFDDYVCGNERITFSAGITLHKAHVPMDKLAQAAEEALEQSKDAKGKNSVTMFGQTVNWSEFHALMENRKAMQEWLDRKYISSAMMYRFNQLITMAGREKIVLESGEVHMEDLDAMKWRSMFHYSIQRNIDSSLKGEDRQQAVQQVSLMADWMNRYGAATRIPLWHLLYDRR